MEWIKRTFTSKLQLCCILEHKQASYRHVFPLILLDELTSTPMHYAPDVSKHKQLFWAIPPDPCVHTNTFPIHMCLLSSPSLHLSNPKSSFPDGLSLKTSKVWLLRFSFFHMVFGSASFLEFQPLSLCRLGKETLQFSPLPVKPPALARKTLYQGNCGRIPFIILLGSWGFSRLSSTPSPQGRGREIKGRQVR